MLGLKRIRTSLSVIGFLLMLWSIVVTEVHANSPTDKIVEEQVERLRTDELEQYWNEWLEEYGDFFPNSEKLRFTDLILPAGERFDLQQVLAGLLRFFVHEILYSGELMVTIVIITVFAMILETLQSAFQNHAVSKVAYAIAYIVLVMIAINSFSVAIQYAKNAIASMIHFMVAVIPMLLMLLASMGNVTSASILHPLIVFMIHTVGTLTYTLVFPLLFFSTILHIVSSLSDKYKVTQLADLLRRISVSLLAVMLTVFLGVISVQGATASVADGVTMKTAKYIAGNFVPVVGRMFSDAGDTVIGASLIIKNAIGLAGVIIIVFISAFPALKILALVLIYNVTAAIMQPLGNSPIVTCLRTIGQSMMYIFAALATVCLMFFLAVTIIIAAGNVSVMVR